jgi:hypothetical protein
MKKHLIILLGHFILASLHYYLMIYKGINEFQFISFIIAHAVWHGVMRHKFRIYGLK